MKISLIIPSFNRPDLLNIGLWSLSQQKISHDIEILVINDGLLDNTENICKKYTGKLNIKHIFTGQRHQQDFIHHRCPGFAINIGVKQCKGDIILLSSPEIFHLNNSIDMLIKPLENSDKLITTPLLVYFDKGNIINFLKQKLTLNIPKEKINIMELTKFNFGSVQVPYFIALYKKHFLEIGGYDEDFIGYASDDNDLASRLKKKPLQFHRTNALIIHLYHGKKFNPDTTITTNPQWMYNYNLYISRCNIINRNNNREWGKL